MATIFARVPYARRPIPHTIDALLNWLGVEFLNIQRAIPPTTVTTVVANYTAQISDSVILVDATAGAVSVSLPQPNQAQNYAVSIKKVDASGHAVTIVGTIDGATNPTLATRYKSKTVVSDGLTYYLLASV